MNAGVTAAASAALAVPANATVKAPLGAQVSLVLMVVTAVLLTIGWRLAVHRRFVAHRWLQTAAVALNVVVVFAWMIRSFVVNIFPALPGKLGERLFAVATAHAAIGAIGLVLGVFVVLRASEIPVPRALRFTNYKRFMRSSYALYLLATVLGVGVYVIGYVPGAR